MRVTPHGRHGGVTSDGRFLLLRTTPLPRDYAILKIRDLATGFGTPTNTPFVPRCAHPRRLAVYGLGPGAASAEALAILPSTPPMGRIARRPWGERSFYLREPFGNPLCFVDSATLFTGRPS